MRKLANLYDFDNINEKFDNQLKEKFYKGTKDYLSDEEQDFAWDNHSNANLVIYGKDLTETQMDDFLSLLHKYGTIDEPLDYQCLKYNNKDISIIEAMMLGLDVDYAFIIEYKDFYWYINYEIVKILVKKCGFTKDELKLLNKRLENSTNDLDSCICSLMNHADFGDIIRSAIKSNYSNKKCLIILQGFNDGLGVEEIKDKIRNELPKEQW